LFSRNQPIARCVNVEIDTYDDAGEEVAVMTGPLGGGLDAEQWLDNWEQNAADQAAKAREMADQVGNVQTSASSKDGSVTVTVVASGAVVDLRLTDQIRRYSSGELANEILTVMRAAQARLTGQVSDIAARTLGADSEAARAVVGAYQQRFPEASASDDDGGGYGDDGGSAYDWQGRRAR
jgi:DNA-binding protein YbaB